MVWFPLQVARSVTNVNRIHLASIRLLVVNCVIAIHWEWNVAIYNVT